MMVTKGKMMSALKAAGVRVNPDGKKLAQMKTYEVISLYYDTFGNFDNFKKI